MSKVLATNTNAAPHTSNHVVLAAAVLTVIADVLDVEQSTLDPSLPLMDLGVANAALLLHIQRAVDSHIGYQNKTEPRHRATHNVLASL